MATTERLIVCADADLASIEARRDVDASFAELEDLRIRVETAELTFADLEEMEIQALEASFALDATGATPTPEGVRTALEDANMQRIEASERIRRVREHPDLHDLRGRIDQAGSRIDALRARLEEFLPESS